MEKRDRDAAQTTIFPSMDYAVDSSSSSSCFARRRHGTGGAAGSSSYRLGRWLMRKLLKHRKMLMCVDSKPAATVRSQYDPVSYSRNFDDSGFGTALDDFDSTHFRHTFSSRFVNKANSKVVAAGAATATAAGCSR